MLCPNCGKEYTGSKCPHCGGPDILVKSEDYLRRKKAWEEMNKAKEEKEKSEQDPAEEQEVQPYTEPQEDTADNEDDTDEFQVNQEEQEKYKRVRFFSCVGIVAAVITLVAVIGYFSVTNIMSIYFKIDENIYKDDYKQEAYQEIKDIEVWNADNSRLFMTTVPGNVGNLHMTMNIASMGGEYFGGVVYDAVQSYYTLWGWNSAEKSPASRIVTSESSIELLYVAGDGSMIFKRNDMVGDGTLVGNTLSYSDVNNKIYTIAENVKSQYIFLRNKSVVYLTNDNNLYVTYLSEPSESKLIASDVSSIMGELDYCEDRYSESSNIVHDTYMTSQLIYLVDGEVIYCNINYPDEQVTLFETEKTGVDIIYEENAEYAYSIGRMSIDFVDVDEVGKASSLAWIKHGTNTVYLSEQETLVYVSDDNKIHTVRYRSGKCTDTVMEDETLSGVEIKQIHLPDGDEGLLAVTDKGCYFYRNTRDKAVKLAGYYGTGITAFSYYGRRIYILDKNRVMYVFDKNGKLIEAVDNTDNVWVG